MKNMLQFKGNIFDQTPEMFEHYREFLLFSEDAPFMEINCADDLDIGAYRGRPAVEVEAVRYTAGFAPDSRLMTYVNFNALAEKNFSKLTFNTNIFRDDSTGAYNRLNECLHQAAKFRALDLDMLVLHASAVVHNDEVLLFSGVSGAGKSTQARLWLEHTDSWALNYDKPIVKIGEDRVLVSGSPWGGKEDLSVNEVRPAKALFFVHQAKEDRVVRLSSALAYSRMYLNYFVYPLTKEIENRYSDTLVRFIRRVPVYDLYCTDTKRAVDCVWRELYGSEE